MSFLEGFYKSVKKFRLILRRLGISVRCLPDDLIVPILQSRIRGKKWIVGSGPYSYWMGAFEYNKRVLFEKTITAGSVILDIGAHAGFYALLASELTGSQGRVFAFEPLANNLRYLKEHLRINRVANVHVVEAAVSDVDGKAMFLQDCDSTMGRLSQNGSIEVRTLTLDRAVIDGVIPLPQFIKIDVEGAEAAVLSGAKQLLSQCHPIIFLSTHGLDPHRKCCEFLISLGYSLKAIDANDIMETDELLAIFGTS